MLKFIAPVLKESEASTFNEYPKISLRNSDRKLASFANSACDVGYVMQTFFERMNGFSVVFSVMFLGNGITW